MALDVGQGRALVAQEAEGRLTNLGKLLLELEQTGNDQALVDSIFRDVHTLKGSSATAGLDEVSSMAHELEELVDDLRTGRRSPTPDMIDSLLAGADQLRAAILAAPNSDASASTDPGEVAETPSPPLPIPVPPEGRTGGR